MLGGCCVMVVGGVEVGLVMIVGYFGYSKKVVVLMVMITNVRLAVVIRKNKFINMLMALFWALKVVVVVNSGLWLLFFANYHHHHHHHPHYHHTAYTRL